MVGIFCKRLNELMTEKNLTQQDIANSCMTTQETVSRWKSGKQEPKISYLIMLANVLEVTTDYLLGMDTQESKGSFNNNTNCFNGSSINIGNKNFL